MQFLFLNYLNIPNLLVDNVRSPFVVPIVDMNVELKASSENRNSMHVLPTPESPISNSLNR